MNQRFTRQQFLRWMAAAAAAPFLAGCARAVEDIAADPTRSAPPSPTPAPADPTAVFTATAPAPGGQATPAATAPSALPTSGQTYLSVARGADAEAITRAALKALGGMERFVKQGAEVVLKPNICVDYHTAEYAATTNPDVVAAVTRLCLEAGAKRVRVMDTPFGGTAERAYKISGIAEAVQAAGGEMVVMSPVKFVKTAIPQGKDLKSWSVYRDALDADVLINIPIAKHHSLARLSLGTKNLFGLASSPPQLHANLGQRAADLLSLFHPTLTIIDAVRILTAHGPTGGSLDDVKQTGTVIASHDPVSADAYAATLFGLKGEDIAYIQAAAALGMGTLDLQSIKLEEINV
jgi:uncharacterized protein (DUF362 family)